MKYSFALVVLLATTSFASDIPELSFEGASSIKEVAKEAVTSLTEKYSPVVQDIKTNVKEFLTTYNPLSLINKEGTNATELLTPENSESSLFTTVKDYVITRPYKMGMALLATVAVIGGGSLYLKNK